MSISIQGSAAAVLAGLDPLAAHNSVSAGASAGASADPAALADVSSPIIDLSGLSPGALGGVAGGLSSDASIADAAVASGTIVEGLLAQMRDAAVSAADPGVDADARAALNAGFQSGLSQIQAAVAAAGVDGVNLIDGSAGGHSPAGLSSYNLTPGGPLIGMPVGASLADPTAAASLADQLESALEGVGDAVSTLSGQANALQGGFAGAMQVGSSGFDPSLDADGARLAALQIQQQLASSGGSIANPSASILALFR